MLQVGVDEANDSMALRKRRAAAASQNFDPRMLQQAKTKGKRGAAARVLPPAVSRDHAQMAGDSAAKTAPDEQWGAYVPSIAHPNLSMIHGDVLPVHALIAHSPFGHLTSDKALIEKLAKAFTTVRFSRGEQLPDSPYYFIARGAVLCRVVADTRPVTIKYVPRARNTRPRATRPSSITCVTCVNRAAGAQARL